MSNISYLLIHKDHPIDPHGVSSGAEMATLALARALAKDGSRVVTAAQLKNQCEEVIDGVEYWDLGPNYDVGSILTRARELGYYHLIVSCRAQAIMQSLAEPLCLSRTFMAHDPSGTAAGISPEILCRVADNVVCVSEAQKSLFVQAGAPCARVTVINNGADLEIFREGVSADRDFKRIVFVGALVMDKGIDILISAFAKIKGKHTDAKLDIYGSSTMWGRSDFFDHVAIEKQIPDIKFHGAVSQAVVAEAFRTAGACVIPSRWFDSFPLTAVEAQVCGCPVVGFNVGGIAETITPGETGMLLSEVSENELVQALDELLSNPSKLKSMSEAALWMARPRFTWAKTAAAIAELCNRAGLPAQSKAKRFGVLTTWNQECGLATYAKYLCSGFPQGSFLVLSEQGVKLTATDEPYVRRCWSKGSSDYAQLENEIYENNLGLIYLNFHDYGPFPTEAFSKFLSSIRSSGVKVVLQLHTTYTVREDLRRIAANVDHILVHSAENKVQVVANDAPAEKISVLTHGVHIQSFSSADKASFRQKIGVAEDENMILSFGFIQPNKGMEGVLEAVLHLSRKGVKARGFIVGKVNSEHPQAKQYYDELKKAAAEAKIDHLIRWVTEFLPDAELSTYLAAADVVLMNYRSDYYEASGACSLAVGAGALVAASVAPPFVPFADSVFRISGGFPAALAVEALVTNEKLRASILKASIAYSNEHSWSRSAQKVLKIFKNLSFIPLLNKECEVNRKSTDDGRAIKVLIQNRTNAYTQRGGDTVLMERLTAGLKARGAEVSVDLEGRADPAQYDIVHLFNFVMPSYLKALGERAKAANTPFVVTTLSEDVPSFHTQSLVAADRLQQYVGHSQDREWYRNSIMHAVAVQPAPKFDNSWTAANATALYTSGRVESDIIRRDYPGSAEIIETKYGCEVGAKGDAALFEREYGVKDFVLCVGRIESRKNQLMLLKALENEEIAVVLAGGGFSYQPDYLAAVKQFKRKGRTIILDRISSEMLAAAYAAARVHALPSWFELPGLVSLEAAAHGCNVVVGDNGTASDYLGDRAFYCNPADEKSIYNAVMGAYYAPRKTGLKELACSFSWEAFIDTTWQSYQKILGRNSVSTETHTNSDVNVDELLERAENLARQREYAQSQALLAEAEKSMPNNLRLLRSRGAIYLAEGKISEAKHYLRQALSVQPSDSRSLSGYGMCELMENNVQEAYNYFISSLSFDADNLVSIRQLLECSYRLNRFDDLLKALKTWAEIHPQDKEMQYCLAGCMYKMGDLVGAEAIITKLIPEMPDHLGVKQLMRILEESRAKPNIVAPVIPVTMPGTIPLHNTESISATPLRSESRSYQAVPLNLDVELLRLEDEKRKRNLTEVRSGCTSILMNTSASTEQKETATALQAELAVIEGNLTEAERIYNDILARNPKAARALSGKGALAANSGDWNMAKQLFEEALSSRPGYDVAFAGLGIVALHGDRDSDKAWGYYRQALKSNPENVRALLGIIELGYPLKRLDQVEQVLREYLDMHPADLNFIYSLAGCLFARGRYEEALSEVSKIMIFEVDHSKAIELREMIEVKMNERNAVAAGMR